MDHRNIVSYISYRKAIIGKFLIVGGSAAALYFLLFFLMVNYLGFDTPLGENVANAISTELSIIYNFFMSRAITWRGRYKEKGNRLIGQLIKFHLTIGISALFRLALFPILQHFGVFYLLNATIGIAVAAIFDFVFFDRLVFRIKENKNV